MSFPNSALLFLADHPWLFALAKGSLVLAITGLLFVLAAKWRLSAAARHALLLAGCVAALAVPLGSLVLTPRWRVGVAPPVPVIPSPTLPTAEALFQAAALPRSEEAPGVAPLPKAQVATLATTPSPTPSAVQPAWFAEWTALQIACALWLAGVAVVLCPLAVAYARLGWQAARARSVTCAAWQRLLTDGMRRAGVRHRVTLCVLPQADLAPATFGLGPWTRIALPAGALFWSETEIRLVLAHELAHVRRCDWLARLMGQLVLAAYWFHPLAWWATRRMGVEAEFACDDRVVSGGADAPEYAACMLEMVNRMRSGGSGWATPAMPFAATLPARIHRVLEPIHNRRHLARPWALGMAASAMVAAGAMGCVRMDRMPQDPVVVAAMAQARMKIQEGQMLTAAATGDTYIVARLLAAGVNPAMRDANGWQPLHWAAKGGRTEACKVLVAAGARASARLEGGETPASLADEGNHRDLSVWLMERAAEDYGEFALQNALMEAARAGNFDSVRRLLAAGADASAQNSYGQTAADLAKQFNHPKLAAYLAVQVAKQAK